MAGTSRIGIRDWIQDATYSVLGQYFRYNYHLCGQLPPTPVIIASTHSSSLDPLYLVRGLQRRVLFMSKGHRDFVAPPHYPPWIPKVNSNDSPRKAIDKFGHYVEKGYDVGIFPEGKLSPEGELGPLKRGVFFFSEQLSLPIYPIAIRGGKNVWPKGKDSPFRKGDIEIIIGKIFDPLSCNNALEELREILGSLYRVS